MNDGAIKKREILNLYTGKNILNIGDDVQGIIAKAVNEKPFPDKSDEQWKKTDLNILFKHKFLKGELESVPEEYLNTFSFYGLDSDRLVFVNGHFDKKNSKITQNKENIFLGSLKEAKELNHGFISKFNSTKPFEDNFFTALNSAYYEDGAYIYIPDNTVIEKPVHIVSFVHGNNNNIISQKRSLIIVGKNSQLKIINTFHSLTNDFTMNNVVSEIIAEENSKIEYYLFQGEGNEASQFNNIHLDQYKGSSFIGNTATLCGALVRNEIHIDFKDEHCEAEVHGLYLPDKEQFVENFVDIKHSKAHCSSKQLYKGIIDNKAKSVFVGKVYVAPDAQKTDAEQSNKNLLLSDNAKAYSRPQLEIYADDVSCAHGSTTGQIDKEALFYLKSRGIPERRAKTMLMSAFVKDVLNKISIKPYRDYINFLVNRRLKGQEVEGLCSVKICPNC